VLDLIRSLAVSNGSKVVLLSLDGLGGLPRPETGRSELETARLPNLSALATEAACGLLRHVGPGITPGSGPGHLGLFGYDPLAFQVGRGVLEALGIEFDLRPGDLAARGNFCTVDAAGLITDRRAGRISTETCVALTERLRTIRVPGVEVLVEPVKEHRFVLVLRGLGASGRLSETDPQALGKPPLPVRALEPAAASAGTRARTVSETRCRPPAQSCRDKPECPCRAGIRSRTDQDAGEKGRTFPPSPYPPARPRPSRRCAAPRSRP
jgi:2,3-bisphosphoglycerate-independent phosphoglycerate mutase